MTECEAYRFNPRTPCGVRRGVLNCAVLAVQFQSTHSLRSATLSATALQSSMTVSIHALLAECDRPGRPGHDKCVGFNPRTPCGVRQGMTRKRATMTCFNPRTPCGVRLLLAEYEQAVDVVSIHALLAECDFFTRPGEWEELVSIHALLAECDLSLAASLALTTQFQSTHSLRSATVTAAGETETIMVSIHALLAECDPVPLKISSAGNGFNPRTPCGVRQSDCGSYQDFCIVSIHALLAECDSRLPENVNVPHGFNPRTPCGVRLV